MCTASAPNDLTIVPLLPLPYPSNQFQLSVHHLERLFKILAFFFLFFFFAGMSFGTYGLRVLIA